jgi:hypothetical protein
VRSVNWFKSLYPTNLTSDDAVAKATSIFRLLIVHHDFLYYQGADRFLWICYVVALAGGPAESAEALTFHLTKATLDAAHTHGFPHTRDIEPELRVLDRRIEREAPAVAAELATFHHTAFHYATRWMLLWFADEHDLQGIFAIWDNVIGVVGRSPRALRAYLYALAVAHVAEVPVPRDGVPMLQAIQQHRDWNVQRILTRAGDSENGLWRYRYYILVVVLVLIALYCVGSRSGCIPQSIPARQNK